MQQDKTILGVFRGIRYSPNHVGNDAAIFQIVVDTLLQEGYAVETCSEAVLVSEQRSADFIFNMVRDPAALDYLHELEDKGCCVVNSSYGIRNCIRRPMTEKLLQHQIPHPKSWIFSTDKPNLSEITYPCWFKRGDSHALLKEDVSFIQNISEARLLLLSFKSRGIPSVVVNEHLEGDLVKFYGVCDTDFFSWFYPSTTTHSKFGWETVNGKAKGLSFSAKKLQEECTKISSILSVPIYGGDCIVSSDGTIRIIDFNDWPSFARCREEAGHCIALCIIKKIEEENKK